MESGEGKHVYKIIYSDFGGRPKMARNLLRNLVGPPGFEPGTSCTPSKRASQAAPRPEGLYSTAVTRGSAKATREETNRLVNLTVLQDYFHGELNLLGAGYVELIDPKLGL